MAEVRWTDEQLRAIENRDKTLLVSAAAGSGKTATLTERIIRSLTDEKNPISIDSLLVVTFTNAAAAELRAKISKALTAAVEANPGDKHLQRQLYMLPAAKIRTIDSFCNEILRSNCDRAGIPSGYRIADTAECELLAISIIEGLIEAVYSGELTEIASPEEFEELCDCLTDSKRTEELAEVFRHIHQKCENAEDGIDLLTHLIRKYQVLSVEDNAFGEYLLNRYSELLDHYIGAYSRYEKIFASGSDAELKYLSVVDSDLAMLKRLRSFGGYREAREAIRSYQLMRKPTVKNKTADIESFSVLRDMMKDDLADIKSYFDYTDEMWAELFKKLGRLLTVFYRFEKKFDEIFLEEKRRRGAFSYADIERYTYKCLIEGGKPTDIARNIAGQFAAIYIDEYQDVNAIQNRIFEAISRPDNRFMVGDIKQSIYGFRSARPEIFAEMKASFPPLEAGNSSCASVFMSRNFRCDRSVVDFVNNVFDRAFGYVADAIGYSDGDRLTFAKKQEGDVEYRYPTVCLADKADEPSCPRIVAEKISRLLKDARLNDGRELRPSDIAIILRNARGNDTEYAEALTKRGIPSCISGAKDFFLSSEVLLALCLLNSIDNPRRDIYLAGLMCSPLFGFTADDLYIIRGAGGETLYEALVAYNEQNPDYSRGVSFIKTLNYYRTIAEGVEVDTLIHKLYSETGLLALASKNGGKENLMLLYDYARSYEAGSFKGLYNFINFINNIIDKKTTFDDTRAAADEDAVKIVTCHASKGLEYPVVFLVEADSTIYNKDRNSRLAFSEDFGISFRLRTPSGLAVVNNPVQKIINHYIARKNYEEELRVLYVALTRARERLFVVGKSPLDNRENYLTKLAVLRENMSEYAFRDLRSYQEIILTLEGSPALTPESFVGGELSLPEDKKSLIAPLEEGDIFPVEKEMLVERFSFVYPHNHLTVLPEKLSVSTLSPGILDGTETESVSLPAEAEEDGERGILPAFVSGTLADESAKRGIATHYFMQFFNLEALEKNGAEGELKRLVKEGFISAADGERVRIREIEKFRKSRLFAEMKGAKRIFREFRFNVLLPASNFAQEEQNKAAYSDSEILVQGVIDCIIERADGSLALYDYKTDRLSKEQQENAELAAEALRSKHKTQLELYAVAVEKIFGKAPEILEVYSLPLGDTVSMRE